MFLKRLELLGAGQSGPERLISIATAAYAYAWAGRRARAVAHSDVATSYETFGEEVATSLRFMRRRYILRFSDSAAAGLLATMATVEAGSFPANTRANTRPASTRALALLAVGVGGSCWRV